MQECWDVAITFYTPYVTEGHCIERAAALNVTYIELLPKSIS